VKRGDLVSIAIQGDFGKPRPALVIKSDNFDSHATVTVLLVSSALVDAPLFRITVQPTQGNGLQKPSQIMVDKVMTVKRDKIGAAFGRLDSIHMLEIERCLAVFLGIAK
jgi:mRNA interferase MazF